MYLNLVELAESFGVSEKVVEDWIRNEGLPHVPDRGRLLFDRARVADWAAAHGLTARAGFLAPESGAFAAGLELAPLLRVGGIWRDVPAAEVTRLLKKVILGLAKVPQPVRDLLARRLETQGGVNWAPVGGGFALPHFSTRVTLGREGSLVALLLLRDPLALTDPPPPDAVPVTRLLFFIPPSPRAHLDMLARLSRAISQGPLGELVKRGATDAELFGALAASAGAAESNKPAGGPSVKP